MKKLSKEAAFNLKTGFGTLISNQSCVEAGKSLPWWIALIIGIVATFIPVIPMMVSVSNTNGETFISSTYKYNFDTNAAIANVEMKNKGYEFEVDGDHYLHFYENGVEADQETTVELVTLVNTQTGQYDMMAYWLADKPGANVNQQYNEYVSRQYILGTTTLKSETDASDTKYYCPSYLFYYKEGNALFLAKANTTTAANQFTGDFINVPTGTKLVNRVLSVEGFEIPTDVNTMTRGYIEGVYNNYKSFYNESYQNIKTRSLLYSTFVYWGIYLGLTLFLGFLIFLLTRGKRNFNNYLKWYQCLCISGWASFTPGLLAMIMGFILTSYAIMFFILFMGVRIMWLSMKQLSPSYQAAQ